MLHSSGCFKAKNKSVAGGTCIVKIQPFRPGFFKLKDQKWLRVWKASIATKELNIKIREARECGPSWLTVQATVWAAA